MKRVNSPRVKILYDIYHAQIMDGDIIRNIQTNFQWIGHFHTGGNPGRHDIDETQELNYSAVAKAIGDLNYTGLHLAMNTAPGQATNRSLCWNAPLRSATPSNHPVRAEMKKIALWLVAAGLALLLPIGLSQSQAERRPQFDAASVRINQSSDRPSTRNDATHVYLRKASIRHLVLAGVAVAGLSAGPA